MKTNTLTPKRTTRKASGFGRSTEVPKLPGNEEMIASVIRVQGMDQPLLVSMPANLPTLQGVLNPSHPEPCLSGRESVIQNLTPLDDDNFFRYGVIRRNHGRYKRPSHLYDSRSARGSASNGVSRPSNLFSNFCPPHNSNENGRFRRDQQHDMSAQLAQSHTRLMNQVLFTCTQMVNVTLQQQCQALYEVVKNVGKANSMAQAGATVNGLKRGKTEVHSEAEKSNHSFYQKEYMQMLHNKYENIRVWKHITGRVEVKFKEARYVPKYIDLYPHEVGTTIFPTEKSVWYEGALNRGRATTRKDFGYIHATRLRSVVDLNSIRSGLEKDPWMFDDLVYIFVCGDIYKDNQSFGTGFISVPTLPPHFMEDETSPNVSPNYPQLSSWPQPSLDQKQSLVMQRQQRVRAAGNTPNALFRCAAPSQRRVTNQGENQLTKTAETNAGSENITTHLNYRKLPLNNQQSNERDSQASGRGQSAHQEGVDETRVRVRANEEPHGVSKYTSQLMNLPEIVVITGNDVRRPTNREEDGEGSALAEIEETKSSQGEGVNVTVVTVNALYEVKDGGGAEASKIVIVKGQNGVTKNAEPYTANLFKNVDEDAASEESLFREIADVVQRRGDLTGSGASSDSGSLPPSLADAPSSISPQVQYETTTYRVCDEPTSSEDDSFDSHDERLENTQCTTVFDALGDCVYEMDQQSHDKNLHSFIRHDLWSPRKETQSASHSIFDQTSIWRTEDSFF